MRLRNHADAPAVVGDQPFDHARCGVRLAGPGRSVHRHVRRIQVEQGRRDVVDRVAASGKVRAAASPGRVAEQDVDHRGAGELWQPRRDIGRRPFDRVLQRLVRDRHTGRKRERQLVKRVAVGRGSLEDDYLSRYARIIAPRQLRRGRPRVDRGCRSSRTVPAARRARTPWS